MIAPFRTGPARSDQKENPSAARDDRAQETREGQHVLPVRYPGEHVLLDPLPVQERE